MRQFSTLISLFPLILVSLLAEQASARNHYDLDFAARDFGDYDWGLDARDVLQDISTRELIEELHARADPAQMPSCPKCGQVFACLAPTAQAAQRFLRKEGWTRGFWR
ncbi:hypothetical protein FA15DRAFT_667902 [Coprinopsis marcescibilis]|nr:hypothetical protein FA15DRAFT_667902 [Coprinopsis marcescibilis]